jgi:transposase-like protein
MVEWMQGVLASEEDMLARILELGLQALMEAERDDYVRAEPFERTGLRRTHRNGHLPRAHPPGRSAAISAPSLRWYRSSSDG